MQPIAQMSTCFPYFEPTKSSGALYHLVATYAVNYLFSGLIVERAKPKSQIFKTPFLERSMFSGLKSRCMIL